MIEGSSVLFKVALIVLSLMEKRLKAEEERN